MGWWFAGFAVDFVFSQGASLKGGSRFGAGRPSLYLKVEQCLSLDIRKLARLRLLEAGHSSWQWSNTRTGETVGTVALHGRRDVLTLNYLFAGQAVNEAIPIIRKPCTLGGARPWFCCPHCGGTAALLYLRGGRFRCRACHRLRYLSQSEDVCSRAWRKQSRLEARLTHDGGRPKGMHRSTYRRVLRAIFASECVREEALASYLERQGLSLETLHLSL